MTLDGLDGGRTEQSVHSTAQAALHGTDQITAASTVANHARIDCRTRVSPAVRHLLAADDAPAIIIRDPQLDAMLAAHRQMGGATAFQMPSGFMRNATFNENKR